MITDIHDTVPLEERVFSKKDSVVISWDMTDENKPCLLVGKMDPLGIFPRAMPIAVRMGDDVFSFLKAIRIENFE